MKQFIKMICVLTLLAGLAFSANKRILKSEMKIDKMKKVEPDYRRGAGQLRADCPHQYPRLVCDNNDSTPLVFECPAGATCIDINDGVLDSDDSGYCLGSDGYFMVNPNAELTVIDSSSNGYGMVSTVTRPMDVNSDDNMLVVYRQNVAGEENTTHGQLGAGYGEVTDGAIQWGVQWNINYNGNPPWGGGGVGGDNTAQARYPSGIASEEYPYAIWNEYTGNVSDWEPECSNYGGRPYFSYDEFGWGGNSWLYPAELDPLYNCGKDLWTGSVGYGYDIVNDEHHVSVVYDDWTRTGSYLFTSEAVEDGYIVLGSETLIVNPQNLGTDGYSSNAILSMNGNGQGLLGIVGIFAGTDMDADQCGPPASDLSPLCNKMPMFKITNDYGASFVRSTGNANSFDFYYVPDEVFSDIFTTWPGTDVDACTGEVSIIDDFWSWYEFDMRVDGEGNPHIVISLIAESTNYFHFLDGYTGFYHLTIDRDNLDNPGPINECAGSTDANCAATGWEWSYVPFPANDSFEWNRPDGYSYLYGTMAQISVSRESSGLEDVIYIVANLAEQGSMDEQFDCPNNTPCDDVEEDPCAVQDYPYEIFPNWSEDIWAAKSSNNGRTWTALTNITNTPKTDDNNDFANSCSPEEQYVHSAHWADDHRVFFEYNQPNWGWNEIGDPLGADHMNRVFLGYAWVTETGVGGCLDPDNCSYDEAAAFDDGSCGIGIYACDGSDGSQVGSTGCGCDNVCGDTIETPKVLDCDNVCGGPGIALCSAPSGASCTNIEASGNTPAHFCCDDSAVSAGGETIKCTYSNAVLYKNHPEHVDYTASCDAWNEVNYWTSCGSTIDGGNITCGSNSPAATAGDCSAWETTACEPSGTGIGGGRCYICFDSSITSSMDCTIWDQNGGSYNDCQVDCGTQSSQWGIPSVDYIEGTPNPRPEGCDLNSYYNDAGNVCSDMYTSKTSCDDANGFWVPFTDNWDPDCTGECTYEFIEEGGDPDQCYCQADTSEGACEVTCSAIGDVNCDGNHNVLDIVTLAGCILAGNCATLPCGCAADLNGDGNYNVLDIVTLAGCILGGNCGGRVDDATESKLIMIDNLVSIEANGFIGGVQMTLHHGDDFTIEMTDKALFADYLTEGNETKLLVVMPETEELFSYGGNFDITEVIVANSHAEVSASLPVIGRFSLSTAYPNPFNPTTTMKLTMLEAGDMQVEVYNLLGQSVSTLTTGYKEAGKYNLTWDATDAASGVYFVKAQADGFTNIQKLMLVK